MKYLGLSNFGGMPIYSSWLLPNGKVIHIDLEREDYFEYITTLRNKYGEIYGEIYPG